jgi:hypothetical protein
VSQVLLWDGDSFGTQEGERLPLEAGTRGLLWESVRVVLYYRL